MDVPMPESLYFMDLPDLRELCTVRIYLNPGISYPCIRDAQIKICRHLLFRYNQIVASPNPEQFDQITVIMAISFYRTGQVQSIAEKYGYRMESPERVTPADLQACLFYTVTLQLSPHWNKAGHLLIQGADFLSKSGKLDAVDLRINVSDTEICICVQVQKIRLPPCELSDFNVLTSTLESFLNNPNAVIQRHFIPNNWCYVLPSMKMGQIVSIGHNIESEMPFKSYKDFQIHWNMLYGYELPSMPEDKVIYCNVYFKLIGEKLFTYPFICLRSQPIQFYPRIDMARILNAFMCDLKSKMPHLCGFPVRITENPLYTVMELTRPQSQIQRSLVNLTSKLPSRSLYQQRYIAATSQKMVPVKQTTKDHVLAKEHPAKLTSETLQMEPLTSSPLPLQVSCPSERHKGTVQRYVPSFNCKNVKVNSSHFQHKKQDESMFRSCSTHSLKEHNSISLPVSSMVVLSKPTQPSFSQIMDTKANVSVRKLACQSMIIKKKKEELSRTMNVTQHPNLIALGKQQVCSASCQIQLQSRPISNSNTAEALQSHTSDSYEMNCIEQIPAIISHKNENASFSSAELLTQEVSRKEQFFDVNPKSYRTKQTIKEVNVVQHAKNNELHKLNNATLQNWLKQHGVSTKARSRKEKLVAQVMQFLQEC